MLIGLDQKVRGQGRLLSTKAATNQVEGNNLDVIEDELEDDAEP
jgi:hypothetical protein